MTLRESLGGDVQRIYEQVDALLDSEDGVLVLFGGGRTLSYTQGFGVSPCQLELLSVELERAVRSVVGRQPATERRERRTREKRKEEEVAGLLVVYFEWRARVLSRIRDERYEGRKAA
jgi:hypothetical protein